MLLDLKKDGAVWEEFFTVVTGIKSASSQAYAATFAQGQVTRSGLAELDRATSTEWLRWGKTLGHAVIILGLGKQPIPAVTNAVVVTKAPSVDPPQVTSSVTHLLWSKFKIDWQVFKFVTYLSDTQIDA